MPYPHVNRCPRRNPRLRSKSEQSFYEQSEFLRRRDDPGRPLQMLISRVWLGCDTRLANLRYIWSSAPACLVSGTRSTAGSLLARKEALDRLLYMDVSHPRGRDAFSTMLKHTHSLQRARQRCTIGQCRLSIASFLLLDRTSSAPPLVPSIYRAHLLRLSRLTSDLGVHTQGRLSPCLGRAKLVSSRDTLFRF